MHLLFLLVALLLLLLLLLLLARALQYLYRRLHNEQQTDGAAASLHDTRSFAWRRTEPPWSRAAVVPGLSPAAVGGGRLPSPGNSEARTAASPSCEPYRGYLFALRARSARSADVRVDTLTSTTTVRLKIIGNEIIKNVGKSESCMVSKLPIISARTRTGVLSLWQQS